MRLTTETPLPLPKMPAALPQNSVGFMGGESLQRPQPFGGNHVRCHQRVHVIWHGHVRMDLIPPEATLPGRQSSHYEFGNLRYAKIRRTARRSVQDPIHRYESLARAGQHFRRKDPIAGEGAMQAESDK